MILSNLATERYWWIIHFGSTDLLKVCNSKIFAYKNKFTTELTFFSSFQYYHPIPELQSQNNYFINFYLKKHF